MAILSASKPCYNTAVKQRRKTKSTNKMETTRLAEPYFVLRFWLSRRNTSNKGHVSFAQDDGTYVGGYWRDGEFVRSRSLKEDVARMGCAPSLSLKLFYKTHLPNVGAIKMWMRNSLIGQNIDPDVTCSSFIYDMLQRGGSAVPNVNVRDITPEVLREIVFQMIRTKAELEMDEV